MAQKVLLRYGTAAQAASANPTLLAGEPGFETDTHRFKLGDGSTAYNDLEYFNFLKIATKSANYTILAADARCFFVTTGATDKTLDLPAGSGLVDGDTFMFCKADSGAGDLIIARQSTDTINGATSKTIGDQYGFVILKWDGSEYFVVSDSEHGSAGDTHAAGDGSDHADVASNTTHRGTTTGNPHSVTRGDLSIDTDDGEITFEGLVITQDNDTNDHAYVPMILHGTDDTPPAASGFPRGTLYIQYTP